MDKFLDLKINILGILEKASCIWKISWSRISLLSSHLACQRKQTLNWYDAINFTDPKRKYLVKILQFIVLQRWKLIVDFKKYISFLFIYDYTLNIQSGVVNHPNTTVKYMWTKCKRMRKMQLNYSHWSCEMKMNRIHVTVKSIYPIFDKLFATTKSVMVISQ